MEKQTSVGMDEINNRVTYHRPSIGGIERHGALADAIGKAMLAVDSIVPNGREKSLAMTKLEEAKMWASAGVARNPDTV